jgi:hypothetical protein
MESLWPIIIIWVLFAIFGRKRQPRRPATTLEPRAPAPRSSQQQKGGFLDELNKALEELKRAERQALKPAARAAGEPRTSAGAARSYLEQRRQAAQGGGGSKGGRLKPGQRLEVYLPGAPVPERVTRPQPSPLLDEDEDLSSEQEQAVSLEGIADYDDEAEQVAAARAKAAERVARREESSEDLSATQLARRAERAPATAIGSVSEHRDWHLRVAADRADQPVRAPRASPLARWADGTIRSAVVLSEILGRPAGDR